MKAQSPTMSHVSRTHRVNLDMLFDGINLDPGIQIKYRNTSKPIADILTKWRSCDAKYSHFSALFSSGRIHKRKCHGQIEVGANLSVYALTQQVRPQNQM